MPRPNTKQNHPPQTWIQYHQQSVVQSPMNSKYLLLQKDVPLFFTMPDSKPDTDSIPPWNKVRNAAPSQVNSQMIISCYL